MSCDAVRLASPIRCSPVHPGVVKGIWVFSFMTFRSQRSITKEQDTCQNSCNLQKPNWPFRKCNTLTHSARCRLLYRDEVAVVVFQTNFVRFSRLPEAMMEWDGMPLQRRLAGEAKVLLVMIVLRGSRKRSTPLNRASIGSVFASRPQ